MKKILTIGLVVASFAATSSFGQGYFQFVTGKSQTYDGSGAAAVLDTAVNVTFLWAPATTADSGILTTASLKTGNSNTLASAVGYTDAQAWAAILGSGFTAAINTNTQVAAISPTASNGSTTYNGGANFGVSGTAGTTPGTAYSVFLVGWTGTYANIAAAAAAGAPVGWSTVFQYTAGLNAASSTVNFGGLSPSFGVFSPFVPTPEPTTLALAGLSGASLLLFRRRK